MLKKTKIWMTAFAVMLAMLVSFVPVHAAELSEETVEVPEDGEKHISGWKNGNHSEQSFRPD